MTLGATGGNLGLRRFGNGESASLRQSRTSILLAVSLVRPKALYIPATALPSLLSSSSQTTRLTTRALGFPRFWRGDESLPAFRASTSSDHCASVDPTSAKGRILDSLANLDPLSAPPSPSDPPPTAFAVTWITN